MEAVLLRRRAAHGPRGPTTLPPHTRRAGNPATRSPLHPATRRPAPATHCAGEPSPRRAPDSDPGKGISALKSGRYLASLRRQQRRTKRMAAGETHTALLELMQRAPTRSNPLLAYLRKTPPGPTGPARDPDRSQSKEDHPTASARAPPPGNNCCFTPPASFKSRQKNTKQSYTGRLIIRRFCSPRPPSSPTTCCALPPQSRRASDC